MEVSGNYGYTKNGNAYKKSTKGKTIGTALGAGIATARIVQVASKPIGLDQSCIKAIKKMGIKGVDANTSGGKLLTKFFNSNKQMQGYILAMAAISVSLRVAGSALIGRFIGKQYDKCADKMAGQQADIDNLVKHTKSL